jgi:hypothetical protein
MKRIFPFIIAAMLISSCGPSKEQIQKAIEQTQIAIPTSTLTFTPSPTNTVTPTSTNTPIPTPSLTPSPTPDVRIISGETQKYLCQANELPGDGHYYLPDSSWMEFVGNDNPKYTPEQKARIVETGRSSLWTVEYLRNSSISKTPMNVYCGIFKFKTKEGALLTFQKYNPIVLHPEINYTVITNKPGLGDDFIVFTRTFNDKNGVKLYRLSIEFLYRNTLTEISIVGKTSEEISYEFAYLVANQVLDKLKEAPLSSP